MQRIALILGIIAFSPTMVSAALQIVEMQPPATQRSPSDIEPPITQTPAVEAPSAVAPCRPQIIRHRCWRIRWCGR